MIESDLALVIVPPTVPFFRPAPRERYDRRSISSAAFRRMCLGRKRTDCRERTGGMVLADESLPPMERRTTSYD